MGGAVRLEPLLGVDLVGADDGAHLVVEDLRRRARERLQSGLAQPGQVVGQGHARAPGSLGHLQCGEAVDVDVRRPGAHGVEHVEVVVAVEVGVDAALQAHLGRTLGLGLGDAPRDLVELQQVGGAPQVERQRALGERAEAALERAHVRVVDVAVAHERHRVAHRPAPQVVGDLGHQAYLGSPGGEQVDDLRRAHLLAEGHARQDLGHRAAPAGPVRRPHGRVDPVGGPGPAEHVGRGHLAARAPRGIARQALGVGGVEGREAQRRMEPALRVEGEGGVHGEPGRQRVARRLGGLPQHRERRPGPLGVDVVGGDRGDPAPVVDAGVQQGCQVVGEVRRRLHVDLGRQDEPGRRDGPLQVLGRAGLGAGHRRPRLGQEVLDDDLLHVAVAGVRRGDGVQGGQLPGAVVADADQDPGGERDGELARRLQRGQPARRLLVGCAAVRRQPLGQRLEHHPLARRDLAQPGQLVGEERAGVGVGEQPRLLHHEAAHVGEILDRRRVTLRLEPLVGRGVAQFGALAQGEERLVAPGRLSGARDGEDLLGGEVRRSDAARRLGEGAIAAAVAAEHGERHEDLRREGDPAPVRPVAHDPGQGGQLGQGGAQEIGVGEHVGQSRGRLRRRRGRPATACAPRARGRPGCRRHAAAPPRRPTWTCRTR